MMNMTRNEEFTLELSLDMDLEDLDKLALCVMQNGHTVLRREKEDALPDVVGKRVYFTFTGQETAALKAGDPAFAQARGALPGGAVIHSEVEEISVYDTIATGREQA